MERTKKEKSVKKFFNRFLSYLILIGAIFALCYSSHNIIAYISLKRENKALEENLNNLKQENNRLEILNEKLKDKDYFSIYVKDKYQYSSSDNSIIPID